MADIVGVIRAGFKRQPKVGRDECRAKLGDQLLARITRVAPTLAPEPAVEPGRVPGPMDVMPISA